MAELYQHQVRTLEGEAKSLDDYKGKALLIVNTATRCGFTSQLRMLEEVYQQYKDRGFEVLAFPCNDFGRQEPLQGQAIEDHCRKKYKTTFSFFDKVKIKGSKRCPLFSFLINHTKGVAPRWNFHKYLVDRNGNVVDYWYSFTCPTAPKVTKAIEKVLG